MKALRLALKLLRRDLRAGELRLLAVAIVVAVAAVTAVDFFTNRIEQALSHQAGAALAADLLVEAGRPLPSELRTLADQMGLQSADSASFPTVLLIGDDTQLVQVKTVSHSYPLRGTLRVRATPDAAPQVSAHGPPAGEAWVEARLLDLTGLAVGDTLALGYRQLPITAIVAEEPDRAANLFRLSPRVLIHHDELPKTGLVGPASRVQYKLMLAGNPSAVQRYRGEAKPLLPAGGRLIGVEDARPELRSALERGDRFLRLTSVSAVLLAMVAVLLASRRFVARQADASALLRCLGAGSTLVSRIFVIRIFLLGLFASVVGASFGLLAQWGLAGIARQWFAQALPAPSIAPWFTGLGIGVLVLAASALPAVWRLGSISPLRVFRRELGAPKPSVWLRGLLPAAGLLALVVWQLGDDKLAANLLGGLLAALMVFWLAAELLIFVLRRWRRHVRGALRYGLSGLLRQPGLTSLQLIGFAFALTALLLLAIVRGNLLSAWQDSLPPDYANLFLLNIQPHEVEPVRARVEAAGHSVSGPYPMLRARWMAHNDVPVRPELYDRARAQRMAAREFNLSWAEQPSADNDITAGAWWNEANRLEPGFSLEEAFARDLNIQLGDRLRFDIAGQTVEAPVTSLRKVQWDSFNVNFFVVGSPGALQEGAANYIASFYLPPGDNGLLRELAKAHPGVSALDVSALMDQVRSIIDRGALAVEAVFSFTLLAGLVVLVAGVQASRETRAQEAALLRTFGQSRRQLLGAVTTEFALLGALAGLLAALAASGISYALATSVFDLPWRPDPWLWLIAVGGGIALLSTAGLLSVRPLINTAPLAVLRKA